MNYMFMPLRRYADFNGRSRRKEFWLWQLFVFLVSLVLAGGFIAMLFSAVYRVDQRGGIEWQRSNSGYESSYDSFSSSDGDFSTGASYEANVNPIMFMEEMGASGWIFFGLLMLWSLFIFIPNLAVTIRRLHDQDKSGWFYLIALIPLIGPLILLIFMFLEGTRGPNRFGDDPKGPDVSRTFA
jgi:uncharacterized membrane protein YhaH (DUF805 family)